MLGAGGDTFYAIMEQLECSLSCHERDRGFKSRWSRHFLSRSRGVWLISSASEAEARWSESSLLDQSFSPLLVERQTRQF